MQFKQHPVLKNFVREGLGCSCPDNVFDNIEVEHINRSAGTKMNYDRILVGNKLLIYLLGNIRVSNLESILPAVVRAGKYERDVMKYNRFRLVLKLDHTDIKSQAQSLFDSIPERDEKTHLHFISSDDAEGLSGIL